MKTVPPNVELLKLAEALESVMPRWVILPQASRLTSTAWNGNARSTTTYTQIDMSAVFGTPTTIDALLLEVYARDSGAATTDCWIRFNQETGGGGSALRVPPANDRYGCGQLIVPTDTNGDIFFDCTASGDLTLDVILIVRGYHLR